MDHNEIYEMMKYIKDETNTDNLDNSNTSNTSNNQVVRLNRAEKFGCFHINTVEDANVGDTICMDCGVVLNERKIDSSGEYMGIPVVDIITVLGIPVVDISTVIFFSGSKPIIIYGAPVIYIVR